MIKATLRSVPTLVSDRREFNCNGTVFGAIRPIFNDGGWSHPTSVGKLPSEYHGEFETASAATDFYAVYSYATPIAWHANGQWTIPPVKYSVTTSRHQGRLYMVSRSA
jgi:hypothetical protein